MKYLFYVTALSAASVNLLGITGLSVVTLIAPFGGMYTLRASTHPLDSDSLKSSVQCSCYRSCCV